MEAKTAAAGPSSGTSSDITFYLNGKRVRVASPSPTMSLLTYLREVAYLRGTKRAENIMTTGCATVVMAKWDSHFKKPRYRAVDSNLMPLCEVDGSTIMTVEALGDAKNMHKIQEKWIESFAMQSGYDTAGFMMAFCALILSNPHPTPTEVEKAFDGNLDRETGYRPILEAAKALVAENQPLELPEAFKFPEELRNYPVPAMTVSDQFTTYYRPASLADTFVLKRRLPEARIVAGNTHLNLVNHHEHDIPKVLVSLTNVQELKTFEIKDEAVHVGAGLSFVETIELLKSVDAKDRNSYTEAIATAMSNVAGQQVQAVSTLGGLIYSRVGYSEVLALLLACGCKMTIAVGGAEGHTVKTISVHEFLMSKDLNDCVILSVSIPFAAPSFMPVVLTPLRWEYKQSRVVMAAVYGVADGKISSASVWVGGVVPDDAVCGYALYSTVGDKLKGASLADPEALFESVAEMFVKETPLNCPSAFGYVEYRRVCALGLLLESLTKTAKKVATVSAELNTLATVPERVLVTGTRDYEESRKYKELGHNIPILTSKNQATGGHIFVDDINIPANAVHGAFVLSPHARAIVKKIDASEALQVPGVVAFVGAKDIPGKNQVGTIWADEYIFVPEGKEAGHVGDSIGMVLAESKAIAYYATKLVKVEYEVLTPIITIDDAVKANSFFPFPAFGYSSTFPNPNPHRLGVEEDEVIEALAKCEKVVEDVIEMGAQEHYYMEPQAAVCLPAEGKSFHLTSSTQVVQQIQQYTADMLDVDRNRVIVKVNRCGGAFGGKESRSSPVACSAALGAYVTKRPCKVILDRDEDFLMTGGRNPFRYWYRVGFSSTGKVEALWVKMWANGGYTMDFTPPVVSRALTKVTNAYKYATVRAVALMCKTNTRSNTAYRGFGDPQGLFGAEAIMERVAAECNIEPTKVREMNLIKVGQMTHYNQQIEEDRLVPMWKQLTRDYSERRKAIEDFNAKSKYIKRGIAAIPSLYGLSFTQKFLCQGSALVHVYTDGSVGLFIGGVELGQGLYTKMSMVCAQHLGVELAKVHIEETASDKCANTVPTSASCSADLCGGAVVHACDQIKLQMDAERKEMKEKNPDVEPTFRQVAQSCFMNRRSLSASGFYVVPDINFDWVTQCGRTFNYYTHGSAISEVELNCLTGEVKLLFYRSVFDVGSSMDPMIDIGQIEGGGLQGMGLFVFERWSFDRKSGVVHQLGEHYTLPRPADVPREWNIELMKGVPNPRSAYSSKGIGEPPLGLGMSAYLAVKDAMADYRRQHGLTGYVKIDSPAVPHRVRMACPDKIVEMVSKMTNESAKKADAEYEVLV